MNWGYERLALTSDSEIKKFILEIEEEEEGQPLHPPSCNTPLFLLYESLLKQAQEDPIGVEAPFVPVVLTSNGYEFSHEGAQEEVKRAEEAHPGPHF